MNQDLNMNQKTFFTPEKLAKMQMKRMESPRGRLLIAVAPDAGASNFITHFGKVRKFYNFR